MQLVAHMKNVAITAEIVALAAKTEQALSQLPTQPDEIAEFLRGHGITGKQCYSTSCPIANWLKQAVPELAASATIAVTPLIAQVAQLIEVDVPSVVSDFIVAFDGGDYCFLFDHGQPRTGDDGDCPPTHGGFD
jgi:hypothetical protein